MRVVLFDIDGTILWSDGAGKRAMEAALLEVFGGTGPDDYHYDGKTDRQIARELMQLAGHPAQVIDARMPALMELYMEGLHRELQNARIGTLPGVRELLDAIEARGDAMLGLLTGNVARGAAAKLSAVGLDIARFRVTAFGCDHEQRSELPAVARTRAAALLGRDLGGDRFTVIGDTPADLSCGRGIGARAIGVATGRYSLAELSRHDAVAIFPDLRDTNGVLRAIFSE